MKDKADRIALTMTLSGRKELHRFIKFVWEIEANRLWLQTTDSDGIVMDRLLQMKRCLINRLKWYTGNLFSFVPTKVKYA